jgi:ubiquitin thioesterase protein OTUB1
MNDIRREQELLPLISSPEPLGPTCRLLEDVTGNPVLNSKILELVSIATRTNETEKKFSSIRYIRRDGSCFYRAAMFALLSRMIPSEAVTSSQASTSRAMFLSRLCDWQDLLVKTFSDYVEDFIAPVKQLVEDMECARIVSGGDLLTRVTDPSISEYLVFFFRYVVSLYIRTHDDIYAPYAAAMEYASVAAYCSGEIEVAGKESDDIVISAFAGMFGVRVVVEVVDAQPGIGVVETVFNPMDGSECWTTIYVLFLPGHYNLLE